MTKEKKERDISEYDDEPVCPGEEPEDEEEMFALYKESGMTVEEVGADDPKEGKRYAKWLKKPENAE
jgi:hypothetical protein